LVIHSPSWSVHAPAHMSYRTSPYDTDRMPPGVPWIIGNEAAERFSFYGMRTILFVFMTQYLHLMGRQAGTAISEAQAMEHYHLFVGAVYFTPLLGALISDIWLGKYRTILWLSLLYCVGHACLAMMGTVGPASWWLIAGLALICLGAGGIKPCVSSNVGDQFGPRNHHLITRVYNWFYFSINFGSFFSTLLTPWLLEWYGPHWAFGIPGVLMAVATLMFWLGRNKFAHIPPAGVGFFKDLATKESLVALGKLIPLFVFMAMFWALYDQTASAWVFQAGQMDRNFLGVNWLESQVQAINPALILIFIPLFTYWIYPSAGRFIQVTPLRKIGAGFLLVSASFALTAVIQSWIDGGATPSIGWQFLSFVVITAAEIMVSIVGLEFAYTQAPKRLKSMIMSLFLLSVFGGNMLTSVINKFIQIPSAASAQAVEALAKLPADWRNSPRTVMLPGYDGVTGTGDDFVQEYENGTPKKLLLPGQAAFDAAARRVEELASGQAGRLPSAAAVGDCGQDLWGNPIRYETLSGDEFRLISSGPDGKPQTRWDIGMKVSVKRPDGSDSTSKTGLPMPAETWLDKRQREIGATPAKTGTSGLSFERTAFSGGQTKLSGADYYWFFTWLMLGTTLVFLPYAVLYKTRTYLQE
jgi:proton-dependent oligopeptide transporter, POT family